VPQPSQHPHLRSTTHAYRMGVVYKQTHTHTFRMGVGGSRRWPWGGKSGTLPSKAALMRSASAVSPCTAAAT